MFRISWCVSRKHTQNAKYEKCIAGFMRINISTPCVASKGKWQNTKPKKICSSSKKFTVTGLHCFNSPVTYIFSYISIKLFQIFLIISSIFLKLLKVEINQSPTNLAIILTEEPGQCRSRVLYWERKSQNWADNKIFVNWSEIFTQFLVYYFQNWGVRNV